jgi:hypothetical protein
MKNYFINLSYKDQLTYSCAINLTEMKNGAMKIM